MTILKCHLPRPLQDICPRGSTAPPGQKDVESDGAITASQMLRRSSQGEDARRPVSRVLSARYPKVSRGTTIPLGRALPRASRDQPGRRDGNVLARGVLPQRYRPYSVLLPVGFTLPPPLPEARCALTAPFHPCPPCVSTRRAVCFLWHCPWGRPRRPLTGTVFPWSPDFPPSPHGNSGRPAVWREGHGTAWTNASRTRRSR
jgi:hypothetical protein